MSLLITNQSSMHWKSERWVCPWWRSDDLNRVQLLIWLLIFGFPYFEKSLILHFIDFFEENVIQSILPFLIDFLTEAFHPVTFYVCEIWQSDCLSDDVNGVWLVSLSRVLSVLRLVDRSVCLCHVNRRGISWSQYVTVQEGCRTLCVTRASLRT